LTSNLASRLEITRKASKNTPYKLIVLQKEAYVKKKQREKIKKYLE
jgi:hypothetical protein